MNIPNTQMQDSVRLLFQNEQIKTMNKVDTEKCSGK